MRERREARVLHASATLGRVKPRGDGAVDAPHDASSHPERPSDLLTGKAGKKEIENPFRRSKPFIWRLFARCASLR
jgi:hypothetical protein